MEISLRLRASRQAESEKGVVYDKCTVRARRNWKRGKDCPLRSPICPGVRKPPVTQSLPEDHPRSRSKRFLTQSAPCVLKMKPVRYADDDGFDPLLRGRWQGYPVSVPRRIPLEAPSLRTTTRPQPAVSAHSLVIAIVFPHTRRPTPGCAGLLPEAEHFSPAKSLAAIAKQSSAMCLKGSASGF